MPETKKPKSVAHDRRIDYYPRPLYSQLVKAYADAHDMSRSAVVEMGVKLLFDTMPQEKKQQIMRTAKNGF